CQSVSRIDRTLNPNLGTPPREHEFRRLAQRCAGLPGGSSIMEACPHIPGRTRFIFWSIGIEESSWPQYLKESRECNQATGFRETPFACSLQSFFGRDTYGDYHQGTGTQEAHGERRVVRRPRRTRLGRVYAGADPRDERAAARPSGEIH